MYKGWAIKSSPCTATFNDLLCLIDCDTGGRFLTTVLETCPLHLCVQNRSGANPDLPIKWAAEDLSVVQSNRNVKLTIHFVLRAGLLPGTFISRPLYVLPCRQFSASGTRRDVEGPDDKQVPGDLVPNGPQSGV
jgi:hypothetical protein